MTEKERLLPANKETGENSGNLFHPEEGALPSQPLSSEQADKRGSSRPWYDTVHSMLAINRNLLLYKAFYFFYFAAHGSLLPYLSLYFKHSLLLPAKMAGILSAVRPFCLFVSAPILGTIADKFNKIRTVLLVALCSYIIYNLLIAVVPPVSVECLSKVHVILNITHNHSLPQAVHHHDGSARFDQEEAGYWNFGQMEEMWNETWLFDLYTKTDPATFKKAESVFIVILVITIVGEFLGAISNTLADVATFQNLEDHPNSYGIQRLWGSIGYGISAFITGEIVERQYIKQTDICPKVVSDIYRPFFFVYCVLMAVALSLATRFNFLNGDKHVSENITLIRGLQIFFKVEYAVFGAITLFLGIAKGSAETFLFMHLVELGAHSPFLFSWLFAIQCISNVLLYYASVYFLEKVGHVKMLIAGLLVYALRFYFFSIVEDPWLVLPVEVLVGISSASVWCALASYVATPPRLGATLQGILHGLYYGLGSGLGQLIGGTLVYSYGTAPYFRYCALVVLLITIPFALASPFLASRPTIWMSLSGYSQLKTKQDQTCCPRLYKLLGVREQKSTNE